MTDMLKDYGNGDRPSNAETTANPVDCKVIRQRQFVGESYIEMHQSLIDSVKQAGGDETAFYYDEIKDMTVSTLFNILATNGIRFTRVIPEKDQ